MPRFIDPPKTLDPDLRKYLIQLIDGIEKALKPDVINPSAPYIVTSGTESRTLNPPSETVTNVAKVLNTLLTDLKNANIIAKKG